VQNWTKRKEDALGTCKHTLDKYPFSIRYKRRRSTKLEIVIRYVMICARNWNYSTGEVKGWSQELTWFKRLKASYHHHEHIQILMRNFITGCYIKQAFHSCWPTQFNQFESLLVHVYKLHNICEDLGQTVGISMAPSKQRTSTTFHVKLSKTRSPLYSIIFVICERVGFILHVTKGRLHLQSDGLYFEGGVFSCPFAVPVVTCTKVLPATSRRETEPAPDLVEPFCCTLDFGFRILLRDRGNIGPSFSDVNRTIIPTTISVLQTHHTHI